MPTIAATPAEARTPRAGHALRDVDATFRAANYLSVAQLYRRDNVLLRERLAPRHIKPQDHPHGLPADHFVALFGDQTEVVLAFHGYPHVIHELLHHRPNAARFHVRGYVEEGTTTTPFDMTVRNGMSRFQLAIEALRRAGRGNDADPLERRLAAHATYIREHGDDLPEVRDWRWSPEVITLGA